MEKLEQTKVIQAIQRIEDAVKLLTEVNKAGGDKNTNRFFAIVKELEKYQKELNEIRQKIDSEWQDKYSSIDRAG